METAECIQRAIDFIEDNLLGELSADVIAGQAYMSGYFFQKVFSIVCGMTLGDYIRRRRLTLAGAELRVSDAKIIDIAYKYGYETPESFSRAFTRFHDISPSAARSRKGEVHTFAKISVRNILGGSNMVLDLKQRGYNVRESGQVYFTKDMDKTIQWFKDVLGWYGDIDTRDESGHGGYGCAVPVPCEISSMTLLPFNGFHLFYGDPVQNWVGFMRVDDIDALHAFVKKNGWENVTGIEHQFWGARECDVTTIDGSVIRFFQLD